MKKLFFVVCLLLVSTVAHAGKVAILPVDYTLVWTGNKSSDKAGQIEKALAEIAEGKGFTVVSHDEIRGAFETFSEGDVSIECKEQSCLQQIAALTGADEAIHVKVEDNDGVDFVVEINFAKRDPIIGKKTGAFKSILIWTKDQVSLVLGETAAAIALAAPTDEAAVAESETAEASEEGSAKRDGLSPVPFWIAVGVAGASAIGAGVLDVLVWQRGKTLEDEVPEDRDQAYWDTTNNLRTTEIVLWSVAGAAAVTGLVLFFFTDFGGEETTSAKREGKIDTVLVPTVTNNGGFLSLQGTF